MSDIVFNQPSKELERSGMNQAPLIHEADDLTFETEVVGRSLQVPVLLDCWAEWCEPCKALGPTLERIVQQYKGRFELVKVDIDKAQRVAMALRIQSVPFMVLFIEGRPVDALVGNQSESEIKAFLDRLLPPDDSDPYERGLEAMNIGDYPAAIEAFQAALIASPERGEIRVAMARAALSMSDLESARHLLESVPKDDPHYSSSQQLMKLFSLAELRGDEEEIVERLARDSADVDAWYRGAINHALSGNYPSACESLLKVVSLDRSYRDDAGRQTLLLIFEVLGAEHELVVQSRRALASYLF